MRPKSVAPQTKFYEIPTMANFPPVHPNEKQSHDQQMWAEISRLKTELEMAKEAFRVAVTENKKLREALSTADRRFRDIAGRNGGPMWIEAKKMLHSDMELIHDGIYEALKAAL